MNRLNKAQDITWPQEPKVIEQNIENLIMKAAKKLRYDPDVDIEHELNTLVSKVGNIYYTFGKLKK